MQTANAAPTTQATAAPAPVVEANYTIYDSSVYGDGLALAAFTDDVGANYAGVIDKAGKLLYDFEIPGKPKKLTPFEGGYAYVATEP